MIGVFYPYLATRCQFGEMSELEISMESIENFLIEDFEFWIVASEWEIEGLDIRDRLLKRFGDKVNFIDHQRNGHVPEPAIFDTAEKMKVYLEHSDTPDEFIRMYDDIYLLGPRKAEDLRITRYLFEYEELSTRLRSGGYLWRSQVMRSVAAVRKYGCRGIMTETHCPELFVKDWMRNIFELFEPGKNRMVTSTLYFNVYPYPRELKDWKTERALFYGYDDEFSYGPGSVNDKVKDKFYLNCNDKGLDAELYRWLMDHLKI
jgi:hypothetical protein